MKVLILIIALLFPGVAFAQIAFPGGWTVGYETIPADTDPISDGANDIRVMKDAVSERLEVDHCFGAGGGCGLEDTGLHKTGSANLLMSADCDAEAIGNHEDGYLCYDTVLYSLWVYDATAVAWVAVNAIPAGTVVIFKHADTCPDGYAEYVEYDGVHLRGRDQNSSDLDIPDNALIVCPGGVGCGGAAAEYDDTLDEAEMPSHTHSYQTANDLDPGGWPRLSVTAGAGSASSATGDGDPHYHPFVTVLFCEKL